MCSHSSLRSALPILAALYVFALAVNLPGITWGLPAQGDPLLPPHTTDAVAAGTDRSWAAIQEAGRDLNFGPPDPDQTETLAKALRRFRLYTADPDEVVAMMAVARLNPLAGRWDPGFSQYGGFFLYTLGATFKLTSALGLVTLRADPSFYVAHPDAMGRMFLVGRVLVVVVSALAIPLVWLLARHLYGTNVPLLAAGLAAVAPAWIAWNHVMKPVAFGAPFALAALLAGARLADDLRPWRATAWAGIFTGLAASAALHYAIFLLGPWIGIALRRDEPARRRMAYGAVAAAAAALTVIAFHPYWLWNPARPLAGWGMVMRWYEPAYSPAVLAAFAWGSLGPALGFPLVIAGVLEGFLLMWRERKTLPILAPAFTLLIAVAVKTGGIRGDGLHARLALPAVLVLAMAGVGGLARAGRSLPTWARSLPVLLMVPTLLVTIAILRNFIAAAGPEGTRSHAGAWINTLPEGTTIGIIAPLAPFRSPFFRIDRYRLVINDHPERAGGTPDPEFFLVAERSEVPASSAFMARYQEVRRFDPPALPLGASARAVYPFADPPIIVYLRKAASG